jgi:hypothetical protein
VGIYLDHHLAAVILSLLRFYADACSAFPVPPPTGDDSCGIHNQPSAWSSINAADRHGDCWRKEGNGGQVHQSVHQSAGAQQGCARSNTELRLHGLAVLKARVMPTTKETRTTTLGSIETDHRTRLSHQHLAFPEPASSPTLPQCSALPHTLAGSSCPRWLPLSLSGLRWPPACSLYLRGPPVRSSCYPAVLEHAITFTAISTRHRCQ